MDCEKCGAEVAEGVDTCPDCGEPMSAAVDEAAESAEVAPLADDAPAAAEALADDMPEAGETFADVPEPPIAVTDEAPTGEKPARKTWLMVLIAVVVVAVLGAGVWYAYGKVATGASPEQAAVNMLNAYAKYDAKGILDSATHETLPADGVKEFETQAAEAKERAGGKAGVKNIKVVSVKMDTDEQATVTISAEWLTDPAKGTYEKREEPLTVVKQDGKWLVKLF